VETGSSLHARRIKKSIQTEIYYLSLCKLTVVSKIVIDYLRVVMYDNSTPLQEHRISVMMTKKSRALDRGKWSICVPESMTRLSDIERLVITKTLARCRGNKAEAARLLGLYRPRLYHKIRKYGIEVKQ
jgi:DNA-binding NtrC family response regulator